MFVDNYVIINNMNIKAVEIYIMVKKYQFCR